MEKMSILSYSLQSALIVVLAIGLTLGVETWYFGLKPKLMEVKSVKTEEELINGRKILWLHINMYSPPVDNCIRLTQHLLYRDKDYGREYLPLGGAMNGANFTNAVDNFTITLRVYQMPPGQWSYINRTAYTCTIWPGLVRLTTNETEPVTVNLQSTLE